MEVRSAHPDVEWQKIAGLRDVIVARHEDPSVGGGPGEQLVVVVPLAQG